MMDTKILNDLQDVLSQKIGMQARFWVYLQSLRQLHIQVGLNDVTVCADLICYRCNRISGPTEWKIDKLTIQKVDAERLIVEDKAHGFLVECELVRCVENRIEPLI